MIVIITIDVEGVHSRTPVESLIYGKIADEEYGINHIMSLCESFRIKASFFVDVYEYAIHGRSVMKQIVANIAERYHDIQLHTHPAWPIDDRDETEIREWKSNNCLYDPQRPWMHQYDCNEQLEILCEGKESLERWTGNKIIAHRAGGYGANNTTLKAAKLAGLKMDFSAFRRHSNCHLKTNANTIKMIKGISEVPATGFLRPNYARFPNLPFKRRFIKTDINWANLDELKFYFEVGERNGLNLMILFMHSYSFVQFSSKFKDIEPNYRDIHKFINFLDWAIGKSADFMTINEFWNVFRASPEKFLRRDYIPVYTRS